MPKEIRIFDLDDTLLGTPTFADFVDTDERNIVDISGNFSPYLKKIKNYIYIIFSKEIYFVKQGSFIVAYDSRTKTPLGDEFYNFIQNLTPQKMESLSLKPSTIKELLRAFKIHDGHLVLSSFPGFHSDPQTIGKYTNNQVIDDYKHATNKMILTGRDEGLRKEIEQRLTDLDIDMPNYGLKLFPGGSTGIQQFKINTILDSIKEENWEEVHFYEDRKDWLEAAKNAVESIYPNVRFVPHYITNIKDSQTL